MIYIYIYGYITKRDIRFIHIPGGWRSTTVFWRFHKMVEGLWTQFREETRCKLGLCMPSWISEKVQVAKIGEANFFTDGNHNRSKALKSIAAPHAYDSESYAKSKDKRSSCASGPCQWGRLSNPVRADHESQWGPKSVNHSSNCDRSHVPQPPDRVRPVE